MTCHLGDFGEYAQIREDLRQLERDGDRQRRAQQRHDAEESIRALKRGDVVQIARGRRAGPVAVLETAGTDTSVDSKIVVIDLNRKIRRLGVAEFPDGARVVGRVKVDKNFGSRSANARSQAVEQLRGLTGELPVPGRTPKAGMDGDQEITDLRRRLRQHPCHGCNEVEEHARWAERFYRLQRKTEGLRRRVESRTATIANQFNQICAMLVSLGYLSQDGRAVTDSGRMLARVTGDTDLVVAESLRTGAWDGLNPPELASVCAALVYESRGKDDGAPPRLPGGAGGDAITDLLRTWAHLKELETDNGLRTLPDADLGLVWAMYRWAQGQPLEAVLWESDMTAGDFVRWSKQVIDLLGQIIQARPGSPVAHIAGAAADLVDRGVVAYSGVRE